MKSNNTLQGTFDTLPIFAIAETGIASNAPERGRYGAFLDGQHPGFRE